MRLIGGLWKRSRLAVAQRPGLRPTPDRVRETLFNWLGQNLAGWRCADVFAGSGALGFEAASRGARRVDLYETDASLVAQLRANAQRLQADSVVITHGNGLLALRRTATASLDLILLDPPFADELWAAALQAALPALADGGLIYLEAPARWLDPALAALQLRLHRYLQAGAVHAHLLCKTP